MAKKPALHRNSRKPAGLSTVWLAAALVFSSLSALLGYDLYNSYNREFAGVQRDAENLTGVLERQFTASGEKIDIVLREAVHEYTPIVTGKIWREVLKANQDLLRREAVVPETQDESLRVIDAKGRVIFSAGDSAALPEVNVKDRAYFLKQKITPSAGLVISEPILSRFTGKWLFTLSRRIDYPDGRFAGVISAPIAIDHFDKILSHYDVGPHGTIIVRDASLGLISRKPAIPDHPAGK